ncbi:MAG: PIN domain-containing protein [Gammaproteobacteria bacterium]|nr:MAG: PIN domain-containing protein [Gammaproteobacteria bacterium]
MLSNGFFGIVSGLRVDERRAVRGRSERLSQPARHSECAHVRVWMGAATNTLLWLRVRVYFSWRPNVPDERDNHLIELAVAAQAKYLVSHNTRDLKRMELRFPQLTIVTPSQLLEKSS